MLRNRLKSSLNTALRPLGVELRAAGADNTIKWLGAQYETVIKEYEQCLRSLLFPALPSNGKRAGLVAGLFGTNVSEAFYLVNHLHAAMPGGGDVCEFGVAQGATSALLANEIRDSDRRLWLFDSFQGLSRPTAEDVLIDDVLNVGSMEKYEGLMRSPVTEVRGRLEAIGFPSDRTRVVAGFIDETLRSAELPSSVCFAYVDFDFYQPIKSALAFLENVLTAGGRIVVDDYGFFSAGAQKAVDEFVDASEGRFVREMPPDFAGHFCLLRRRP